MRIVKMSPIRSMSLVVGTVAGTILMSGAGWGAVTGGRLDEVRSVESDCAGMAAKERELGLMAYRQAIAGARPLREETSVGKVKIARQRGTVVVFRAEPNMSGAWLRRVNACHADLVAAGRLASGGGTTDPFAVPGTTVAVDETQTGYAVSIHGDSDQAVAEVAHRIAALSTDRQEMTALNVR